LSSKRKAPRHSFRRNKYNVSPKADRTVDGIVFDSKREAARYKELGLLREQGEVLFFLRQTPFHLPGKTRYLVDFTVFWASGAVTFEDVKGVRTASYKTKKRQVEEIYFPAIITEIA